jgi:superfamily II DNA or RNA helicase
MPEQTNEIRISNVITLDKTNLDPGTLGNIRLRFSYDNPKYLENQRLGFSNYSTNRTIDLYQENGAGITFPRGLVKGLFQIIPNIKVDDQTVTNPVDLPDSQIQLRPYQEKAVAAMTEKNQGVLVMPPGAGKTVSAIEAILRRGQKTLWLTHTKDLKQQAWTRFKDFTGIEPGLIDDKRFDAKEPVIIGMVQSLSGKRLTEDFLNSFGCVILDEAHHCPAYTFERLLNLFPARYRYGLTATPERRDGLSFMLHGVFGPVIHTVEREELFSEGQIIKPLIRAVRTNFYMPECDDYRTLLDGVTNDADRTYQILTYLSIEVGNGHSCLVLSERISHIEGLYLIFSTIESDVRAEILTSKVPKAERKAILRDAEEGKVKVLFATKLADEGLDVPRLDRLFLTCPARSGSKVTQQVGRIMRTFPGKIDAKVYDFIDKNISLAWSQWLTRKREAYKDFEIEEFPYDEHTI